MESECGIVKYNFFLFIGLILFALACFSIAYYVHVKRRFEKKKNLVIEYAYFKKLFEKNDSMADAAQGDNGDLWIENVTFSREDFCPQNLLTVINEEMKKLEA